MSTLLYFDCFAGAAGDMVLGALLDAGLPFEELRGALGTLGIGGYELSADRVLRCGISATKFRVLELDADGYARGGDMPAADSREHGHGHHQHGRQPDDEHGRQPDHEHDHKHDHEHHPHDHEQQPEHGHTHEEAEGSSHGDPGHDVARPTPGHAGGGHDAAHREQVGAAPGHGVHRTLREIESLIEQSALGVAGRRRAIELFRRLAEAEAAIHQMPVEQVHLHEVGALDSIIDIVGAVFALEWFGADRIVASPMNVGGGMVRTAHGMLPVPAPATASLLRGVPTYSSGPRMELVTPTGALLVTGYATEYGPMPQMRVDRIGYGAGDRDLGEVPNVLRVFVGRAEARRPGERIALIECEIDDMNPQIYGVLMDTLYAAGALEVFYTAVQMKKGRPGTLVTVLAPPERREAVGSVLFAETTTIGLRHQEIERECLERRFVEVSTPIGTIRFKLALREGRVVNAVPEFDDCARVAREQGRSVKDVQAIAIKAYLDIGGERAGRGGDEFR